MIDRTNKQEVIHIRVTKQQLEDYKFIAKRNGMSLSNYVRQHLFDGLKYKNPTGITNGSSLQDHLTNANVYALRRDLSLLGSSLNNLIILVSKKSEVAGDIEQSLNETLRLTVIALHKLSR